MMGIFGKVQKGTTKVLSKIGVKGKKIAPAKNSPPNPLAVAVHILMPLFSKPSSIRLCAFTQGNDDLQCMN
jgi:hypothetical protein